VVEFLQSKHEALRSTPIPEKKKIPHSTSALSRERIETTTQHSDYSPRRSENTPDEAERVSGGIHHGSLVKGLPCQLVYIERTA
jgi:hypothetical protein